MINKRKRIKNYLLSKLLKGRNVYCNICNQGFTTFIPHMHRINACCPNCGSLERTRLLWYYVVFKKLLKETQSILHVAPERSLYKILSKKTSINYLPVDKFTEGYEYPSKTVDMDVADLNYKDESIDGIICIHVLEHVVEDIKALKEFYRVLKPKAWALVLVPYDKNRKETYEDAAIVIPEERYKHFGQSDHVRIYGTDFINRFKSVGFAIEDWGFEDTIDLKEKEKYVFKSGSVFLLRK